MPIAKRLSQEERVKKQLPKGWSRASKHPLIQKLCYGRKVSNADVVQAIAMTRKWKGATWWQKVFTISLDLVLEKAFGEGILAPDIYNRLQDHLENNENKIHNEDIRTWMTYMWDFYHDHYGLHEMEPGDLELPKPVRKIKKSKRLKRRRKKP